MNFSRFFMIFIFFQDLNFFYHFNIIYSCISPYYYNCFHIATYLKVCTFSRTTSLVLVGQHTFTCCQKSGKTKFVNLCCKNKKIKLKNIPRVCKKFPKLINVRPSNKAVGPGKIQKLIDKSLRLFRSLE